MLLDIVLVFLATSVSAYLTAKDYFAKTFKLRPLAKSLIIGAVASAMFLASYSKEQVLIYRARPSVAVTTRSNPDTKRVDIQVNVKKGSIRTLNIQYPFNGIIDRFIDENPQKYGTATAYALPSPASVIFLKESNTTVRFSENLDLSIADLPAGTELKYIVYYTDSQLQRQFHPDFIWRYDAQDSGRPLKDLYILEYQWERDKHLYNESEVRLVKDDTTLVVRGKRPKASELPKVSESFIQSLGSDPQIARREAALLLRKRRLQ